MARPYRLSTSGLADPPLVAGVEPELVDPELGRLPRVGGAREAVAVELGEALLEERLARELVDAEVVADEQVVEPEVCAAEKIGPNIKWNAALLTTTCSGRSCRKSSYGADS